MIRRLVAFASLTVIALSALAGPASAHVEIEPEEAVAGSATTLTFVVEYEGAATTGLVVQLPEGAAATEVPAKDGWTSVIDSVANTATWSGGSAPVDESFDLVVQLPTTPGEVLFPAIVQTTDGEEAWIEEAESEGETGKPAPRLTLTADPNATTATTTATTTTAAPTTTTTSALPGTTLEADQRDDGNTSAAPWIIGSGIAAVLAIASGGLFLKRKQDRENEQDQATAATDPAVDPEE